MSDAEFLEEVEIVFFNDKSWVRFSDFMEIKTENRNLKNDIEKMKKKITDLIYNDENCLDKIIGLLDNWESDE